MKPKKGPFISDEHFQFVRVFGTDEIKPFVQAHRFVKNNQAMTREDFVKSYHEIRDYMTDQGVNFGLLMFADGTYVFTEKKTKLNGVMVKLTTGVNYNGVVQSATRELAALNSHLGR